MTQQELFINGCKALSFEISKAALLHSMGLAMPRSRIVNCAIQAVPAAQEIGFSVIVKPNIGGRGAGLCVLILRRRWSVQPRPRLVFTSNEQEHRHSSTNSSTDLC